MTFENNAAAERRVKPRITLTADDYARLSTLADAAMNNMPDLAAGLADELGRAEVLAPGDAPEQIVCMNSEVTFRDDTTGKLQTVTLVYPSEADILQGRISVLTPVGTALIGLRTADAISWQTPAGEQRQLTVLSVARR
jgi:regulator of nucleoside diphosphate kinase